MNTDHHQKTAKIYTFPVRARTSARNTTANQDMERFSNYVDCGSRYHQDAIDAERKSGAEDPVKLS